MSPADRCDRIIDLIDRVLTETGVTPRPTPAPVLLPVPVRPPRGR
jgi:hypothetical protein